MKKLKLIVLMMVLVLTVGAIAVGCHKDGQIDYSVTVIGTNGKGLKDVEVFVSTAEGLTTSGVTDEEGKFYFRAKSGEYVIEFGELSSGYVVEGTDHKVTSKARDLTVNVVLKDKDNIEYTVNVFHYGDLPIPNVRVNLKKGDTAMGTGSTNSDGAVTIAAKPDAYVVEVDGLPDGYSLVDPDNPAMVDSTTKQATVRVTSAIIADPVDDTKVYNTGDVIHDFSCTDPTITDPELNSEYTLSEIFKTKQMVLLNFWSTNCTPCMSEMPELERAYRKFKDKAEILALNVPLLGSQSERDLRTTRQKKYKETDGTEYSLTFPMAIDGNMMPFHFNMNSIPVTVIVDRYGIISEIHRGSMDKAMFEDLFEKYTADDYVPVASPQKGEGTVTPPPAIEREKPDVEFPSSETIEQAINGDSYDFNYYPERGNDAEYSWPWLVSSEGESSPYIYPANTGTNYSYATIYTSVVIDENAIRDPNGKKVLAFDFKYQSEEWCDYFYVIVNNNFVYEFSGIDEWKWQTCYALIADEPGTYELALLYNKDQQKAGGADTVRIRNMRLISVGEVNAEAGTLDMPRDAVKKYNATDNTFESYVDAVMGEDGFYHMGDENGPYILANLFSRTQFNIRIPGESTTAVNEYAIQGMFDYNSPQSENRDPSLDKTEAITKWLVAANNSEIPGLTTVNADLAQLLNEFSERMAPQGHSDKDWLQFCIYFEHYGSDENDKGISTPDRNPVRGVIMETAFDMVAPHQGAFDVDGKGDFIIDEQYKNTVIHTRLIMPRGWQYKIVPTEAGVYRFRSQSKTDCDTMAWLRDKDGNLLVETEYQLENPDYDYNFVITYYLEANQPYYLAVTLADMGIYNEFTFTTEYLGPQQYVWQYASRNEFTSELDDEGGMAATINYFNVQPVLVGNLYYNAKKGADGKYIVKDGKYEANLDDPLYVDFTTPARFFDEGSLQVAIERAYEPRVRYRVSTVLKAMYNKALPTTGSEEDKVVVDGKTVYGYDKVTAISSLKGSNPTDEEWNAFIIAFDNVYGGEFNIAGDAEAIAQIKSQTTVGGLTNYLRSRFVNYFDFSKVQFSEQPDPETGELSEKYTHVTPDMYRDYTTTMENALKAALANTGDDVKGPESAGCTQLTSEMAVALKMFAWRLGNPADVNTDWIRFCAHFEYMGPVEA